MANEPSAAGTLTKRYKYHLTRGFDIFIRASGPNEAHIKNAAISSLRNSIYASSMGEEDSFSEFPVNTNGMGEFNHITIK